ncbi:hypothetical protein [Staphylococcus phage vB_SsapH-Golestan101-M]|nr:hypothetical protein [Staphylococcus phage vB_SsapH-Golestan101-M]
MFRRKSENIQDSIKEKINEEYNVELRKKQEHQKRLNTDTHKSYELDKIIEEHLSKLEDVAITDLRRDSIWLGTIGIYYYPIGQSMNEQVYSINELEYMKKQFKKLGFKTQISNSQVGFTPYIYLRLIWEA